MAASTGRSAPLKPWERPGAQGGSNTGSPFAPTSSTSSTASIISSGVASSGENKDEAGAVRDVSVADGRQMPLRPWERSNTGYGSITAGYGSGPSGYGSTSYNRPYGSLGYGGYGGTYGADYRGSYLGNSYGSSYGGMYGGSPYGGYGGGLSNRYGGYGGMGGYNMGPMVPYGGYGPGDPNNPDGGSPPRPPSFWESVLHAMHRVVNFFGRISILVDENTQAIHFFITALLQLCDRAGVLYGELARFVLRLLGFRTKARERSKAASSSLPGSETKLGNNSQGVPKGDGTWDNVWLDNNSKDPKQ